MNVLKPIIRFCAITLFVYVLLVIRWPGVREAYRSVFMTTIQGVYAHFGAEGTVSCKPRDIKAKDDVDLYLGNLAGEAPVAVSSGTLGYAPLVFFAGLIVATPIPWRRRWRPAFWGFVFVNLFVILRTGIYLFYWFSTPSPVRLYTPGPFLRRLIDVAYEFLALSPGGTFIVTAIIWAAVTWRAEDVQTVLSTVRRDDSQPREE